MGSRPPRLRSSVPACSPEYSTTRSRDEARRRAVLERHRGQPALDLRLRRRDRAGRRRTRRWRGRARSPRARRGSPRAGSSPSPRGRRTRGSSRSARDPGVDGAREERPVGARAVEVAGLAACGLQVVDHPGGERREVRAQLRVAVVALPGQRAVRSPTRARPRGGRASRARTRPRARAGGPGRPRPARSAAAPARRAARPARRRRARRRRAPRAARRRSPAMRPAAANRPSRSVARSIARRAANGAIGPPASSSRSETTPSSRPSRVDHRGVPHAEVEQLQQHVLGGAVAGDGAGGRGHDLADDGVRPAPRRQHALAEVAVGEDAETRAEVDQRARRALVRHAPRGLADGRRRREQQRRPRELGRPGARSARRSAARCPAGRRGGRASGPPSAGRRAGASSGASSSAGTR